MLKCEEIQNEISAYIDRENPLWKQQLIKLHLSQCKSCAFEVTQLRELHHTLKSIETETIASENFISAVMQSVDQPIKNTPKFTKRLNAYSDLLKFRISRWFNRIGFDRVPNFANVVMAASFLAMVAIVSLTPHTENRSQISQPIASAEIENEKIFRIELVNLPVFEKKKLKISN